MPRPWKNTSSPDCTRPTSGPTASTTPAPSLPMILGGFLGWGRRRSRTATSTGFTLAACDAHEHLSGPGRRCGDLLVDEHLWPARLVDAYRFHRPSRPGLSAVVRRLAAPGTGLLCPLPRGGSRTRAGSAARSAERRGAPERGAGSGRESERSDGRRHLGAAARRRRPPARERAARQERTSMLCEPRCVGSRPSRLAAIQPSQPSTAISTRKGMTAPRATNRARAALPAA